MIRRGAHGPKQPKGIERHITLTTCNYRLRNTDLQHRSDSSVFFSQHGWRSRPRPRLSICSVISPTYKEARRSLSRPDHLAIKKKPPSQPNGGLIHATPSLTLFAAAPMFWEPRAPSVLYTQRGSIPTHLPPPPSRSSQPIFLDGAKAAGGV